MTSPVVSAFAVQTASQLAGSKRPYEIDVSSLSVEVWQPAVYVAASSLMRPTDVNETGFVYQAAAAGFTALTEPSWPKVAAGTVTDGSVTWTAETPVAAGQDSITSVTWTQVSPPDATVTIASMTNTGLTAKALIGGGTSGNTYEVLVSITMSSGAIYPVQIFVSVL